MKGNLHGHGTYTGEKTEGQNDPIFEESGNVQPTEECKNHYIGDWSYGMKNGHGIFNWADGSVYEGDFKDDQFHGKGEYTRADGKHYKGKI